MKLIEVIKYQFCKVKWAYQRAIRGYSDWDVGDIDCWFLEIIPNMLKDFKDKHSGIPIQIYQDYFAENKDLGITYNDYILKGDPKIDQAVSEKWDSILDRMIYCFTEADEDRSKLLEPEGDIEALYEHCDVMLKEGFELFSKNFRYLWN